MSLPRPIFQYRCNRKEGPMTVLSVSQWCNSTMDGVAELWRRWTQPDASTPGLQCFAKDQLEQMARDIGVSPLELQRLARLGPGAADLLMKRMAALSLDRTEVSQVEPGVLRDMQRTCALCSHHRRCAGDMAHRPDDESWSGYCPNAATLKALNAMPWPSRREW
jgi:hypothetical protein